MRATTRPNHPCVKCADRGDDHRLWWTEWDGPMTRKNFEDGNPIWICSLCWHEEPRQVRVSSKMIEERKLWKELFNEGD